MMFAAKLAPKLRSGATAVLSAIGLYDVANKVSDVKQVKDETVNYVGIGLIGLFVILLLRR